VIVDFCTHVSHIYRDYQTYWGGGGGKYQNQKRIGRLGSRSEVSACNQNNTALSQDSDTLQWFNDITITHVHFRLCPKPPGLVPPTPYIMVFFMFIQLR
jgi:hypothetical protein